MNKIVKAYIAVDILFWSVNIFMISFFPIYTDSLLENQIITVTLVVAAYAISRGLFQIPLSKIMDKIKSDSDEKIFMILGIFISAFSILILMFNTTLTVLIIRQLLAGLGNGMFLVAGKKEINNHIDRADVGYEIAVDESSVLLISAFILIIAGGVTSIFGFHVTFLVVGIVNLLAFIPMILISRDEMIEELKEEGIIDKRVDVEAIHKKRLEEDDEDETKEISKQEDMFENGDKD